MKNDKAKLTSRIIRITLMVILGLVIILGIYHVIKNKNLYFSPQANNGQCEEKAWCLDYDTIASISKSCETQTVDCQSGEKCSNSKCVKT